MSTGYSWLFSKKKKMLYILIQQKVIGVLKKPELVKHPVSAYN